MTLRCLILTENPALAASLRLCVTSAGNISDGQIAIRTVGKPPVSKEVHAEFNRLCDWIEHELSDALDEGALPDLIVLTDLGAYDGGAQGWQIPLPLSGGGWSPVLGLLLLAFPEIHWGITAKIAAESIHDDEGNVISLEWDSSWHCIKNEKLLSDFVKRHQMGFVPLFDPTGLRSVIRHRLSGDKDTKLIAGGIPIRTERAAAIDEETGYAFLHGYAAYRFGFRVHAVTTYTLMERLFEKDSVYKPALVIEDFFLNFPDHHPDDFSQLAIRKDRCPHLETVPNRVFVTIGLKDTNRDDNKTHLLSARTEEHWNRICFKPLAGIYNLWEETKLNRRLRGGGMRGYAEGFVWPPKASRGAATMESQGHSAPGRLLVVANRLIQRAERLGGKVHSPVSAVYGAILAIDALELLADRTPTTGIDALLLKHQFEVLAECQFSGVEYHISIRPRLKEIERETEAISRWFQRGKRETAWLNAQMQIVNKLITVLQQHNQFDEEQICRAKARELHNTLWMRQRPARLVLAPILRYSELLLAKFSNFMWAVAGWVLFFTSAFYLIRQNGEAQPSSDSAPLNAFGQTVSSFFGAEPFASGNTFWQIATVGAVVVGVAHVSLLTAHLYSVMSRK